VASASAIPTFSPHRNHKYHCIGKFLDRYDAYCNYEALKQKEHGDTNASFKPDSISPSLEDINPPEKVSSMPTMSSKKS
jgi:hypothetical protein